MDKECTIALSKCTKTFQKIFDAIIDEIPLGIAVTESGVIDRYIVWNRQLEKMLSIPASKAIDHSPEDIFADKEVQSINIRNQVVLREKKTVKFSKHIMAGKVFDIIKTPVFGENGEIEFIVTMLSDMSGQKEMMERLVNAEKMQMIGQLAGGIAHDFNNQLMSILGYSRLLLERVHHPELSGYLGSVIKSAEKSAELTAKLLAYSRKGKLVEKDFDLNLVIDEVLLLARYKNSDMPGKIRIEKNLSAGYTLRGDSSLIQNALFVLAINSLDAMPDGGDLLLSVEKVFADTSLPHFVIHDVPPGHYLKISVKDSGAGIAPETMNRIFEPFFTTKKQGEGTGMGLPAVFGTVKSHNGTISIESTPGKGTCVSLFFPYDKVVEKDCAGTARPNESFRAEKTEQETSVNKILPQERAIDSKSKELFFNMENNRKKHIMVVDDESVVRDLTGEMLRRIGYDVTLFDNAISALLFYEKHTSEVDLVILDMIMPHMGGKDAFFKIRKINPEVKVIILSGFSIDNDTQELINEGIAAFIQKPVSLSVLKNRLEQIFSPEASGEKPDAAGNSPAVPAVEGVDVGGALEKLDGDSALYLKLVERFLENYKNSSGRLMGKYRDGDFEWLHTFSHSIKSVAGNLGAEKLAKLSEKVESLIKSGEKEVFSELTGMADEMDRLVLALEAATPEKRGEQQENISGKSSDIDFHYSELKKALKIHSPKKTRELISLIRGHNLPEEAEKTINEIEKYAAKYNFSDALKASELLGKKND